MIKNTNYKEGFFNEIKNGVANAEKSMLGPTHNYAKEILAPSEMGMGSSGNMDTLARNVSGIMSYTDVLVSGKSNAQQNCNGGSCKPPCDPRSGRNCSPLGNSFYLKTGGKCKDESGQLRTRYMYINNKPTGAIPFISKMTGKNTPGLRGLIPGAIENLGQINPIALFSGFMQGVNPNCRKLNLKADNGSGHYVADSDISDLDPCLFEGGYNPVSKIKKTVCGTKSGFENLNKVLQKGEQLPKYDFKQSQKDPVIKFYNFTFGMLIIYLMFKATVKTTNV